MSLSPMPAQTEKTRTAEVQDLERGIFTDGRPNDVRNDTPWTPDIPTPVAGHTPAQGAGREITHTRDRDRKTATMHLGRL